MDCQVCFGNDFDLNNGSYYCSNCGTEKCAQDFVHEHRVEDSQDSDDDLETKFDDYPDTPESSSPENSEDEESLAVLNWSALNTHLTSDLL